MNRVLAPFRLNILSRSWFWLIIGVATLEALFGFVAVMGTVVTFFRKRIDTRDPLFMGAMMRHLANDLRWVLRTGRLPR
jgi:hypothetical protein